MAKTDVLLETARERIRAIDRELARLGAKEFPVQAAGELIQKLRSLLGPMNETIARLHKRATRRRSDWKALSIELEAEMKPAQLLHEFLKFFDKLDSSRVPFELLRAFESLAGTLAKQEMRILLRPDRVYNYGVLNLQSFFEDAGEPWTTLGLPYHVLAVSFPSAEADSALLHTLLFHELGHVAFPQVESSITVVAQNAISRALGTDPARAQEREDATACLLNWVEEVYSDLLALRLVGPAFLCAFQRYTIPFLATNTPSDDHPDYAIRIEILREYVKVLSIELPEFAKALELFGPDETNIEAPRAPDVSKLEAHQLHARNAVASTEFRQEIFKAMLTEPTAFSAATGLAQLIDDASEDIRRLVPPGSGSPCSSSLSLLTLAFNAAWLFRVRGYKSWKEDPPVGLRMPEEKCIEALNQVLLAAVEAGQLALEYDSLKRKKT